MSAIDTSIAKVSVLGFPKSPAAALAAFKAYQPKTLSQAQCAIDEVCKACSAAAGVSEAFQNTCTSNSRFHEVKVAVADYARLSAAAGPVKAAATAAAAGLPVKPSNLKPAATASGAEHLAYLRNLPPGLARQSYASDFAPKIKAALQAESIAHLGTGKAASVKTATDITDEYMMMSPGEDRIAFMERHRAVLTRGRHTPR